MAVFIGNRLTGIENNSRAEKLILCLERGGERLKDEEIGLRKPFLRTL